MCCVPSIATKLLIWVVVAGILLVQVDDLALFVQGMISELCWALYFGDGFLGIFLDLRVPQPNGHWRHPASHPPEKRRWLWDQLVPPAFFYLCLFFLSSSNALLRAGPADRCSALFARAKLTLLSCALRAGLADPWTCALRAGPADP